MKWFKSQKKGNITLFLVFLGAATILLIISAVVAPLGVQISTEFYAAGEDLINESAADLSMINDQAVAAEINATLQSGLDNTQSNIELYTAIYKYGGWIAIFLTLVVVFLFARRMVEYGYQGGFI